MPNVGGLHYEESGSGEALLLIHGGIVAGAFGPLLKQPALQNFRTVRYDRMGMGGSERIEGAHYRRPPSVRSAH